MRQHKTALFVGSIILALTAAIAVGLGSLMVSTWLLGLSAAGQAVQGPYLGLTYVDYNPRIARQCCAPGALVTAVDAGGPADEVGIRPGDVIAVFDGHPLGDGRPLLPLLLGCQPGERVVLEMWRAGHARQVEIVLGRRGPG